MSRFFTRDKQNNDQYGDIIWRKSKNPSMDYDVYVGDRKVGHVYFDKYSKWCYIALGSRQNLYGPRSIKGFATRWFATECLLDVAVTPCIS